MAMWGGRFDATPNELVARMGESVSFDRRLYKHDIEGSVAHAKMLGKQGIIPQEDANSIVVGLNQVREEIESGKFEWSTALEDVHMNIESRLTKIIGPVGGKLHSGRSRNDQVCTTVRLYLRDETEEIVKMIKKLQQSLVRLSNSHTDTIVPGFTHLQHAQPIILGHFFLAYTEMFERDIERIKDAQKRLNSLPLGSGALAGSTLPLNREFVSQELKFEKILQNSLDAVADRDFLIEVTSSLAITMMHLSRLSEDLIFWISQEANWIELGDEFCTGSSLMPQKKNPDMCELTRGKCGRVYGDLFALLTIMKGLPLAYNRDMQEDKQPLFDAIDQTKLVLSVYSPMIDSIKVDKNRMLDAASDPALMATDVAEWLVKNGVPFREAHHRVGKLVALSKKIDTPLNKLTLEQVLSCIPEANKEVLNMWKPTSSVNLRNTLGGTAPDQVRMQIENRWKHFLA